MPLPVIVDTNFLLLPAQFGIDIFTQAEEAVDRRIEFIVLDSVAEEVERKASNATGSKEKRLLRVTTELMKRCKKVEVDDDLAELPVDDQVLEYAKRVNGVIATNDKKLRSTARKHEIPLLILRGRKRVVVEGLID
ncbi:MAG: PIN domain-containing protein [Candidatus Thorarchaeota archaeon]|nr:PIN domain-containing protein [Candidatus Thorarchaeota archaeon]